MGLGVQKGAGGAGCHLQHATRFKVLHYFSGTKPGIRAANTAIAGTNRAPNPLACAAWVSLSTSHAVGRIYHRRLRPRRAALERSPLAPRSRLLFPLRIP